MPLVRFAQTRDAILLRVIELLGRPDIPLGGQGDLTNQEIIDFTARGAILEVIGGGPTPVVTKFVDLRDNVLVSRDDNLRIPEIIAAEARLLSVERNSLVPTAVKTSAYTLAANDYVPVDTTSGAVTVTLPSAPADGVRVGVKHVIQGSTNAVTIARGGSDVFNKAGGSTSLTLPLLNQGFILQYRASTGVWYAQSSDTPLSALDARYQAADGGSGAAAALALVLGGGI